MATPADFYVRTPNGDMEWLGTIRFDGSPTSLRSNHLDLLRPVDEKDWRDGVAGMIELLGPKKARSPSRGRGSLPPSDAMEWVYLYDPAVGLLVSFHDMWAHAWDLVTVLDARGDGDWAHGVEKPIRFYGPCLFAPE